MSDLLETALAAAVPMWIHELSHCTPEIRLSLARECGEVVAHQGDIILYRSGKAGETAKAFNALAKGLAIGAYQPGGVTAFGQHWEVK